MNEFPRLTQADLDAFYAQEQQYYRYPLVPVLYTEGAKFVADRGEAYWLLDKIATMQLAPEIAKEQVTQLWTLHVHEESWALVCQDGDYHVLWAEGGGYTDFPLPKVEFLVQGGVIMLPSEY
jgi:hypothetical protein